MGRQPVDRHPVRMCDEIVVFDSTATVPKKAGQSFILVDRRKPVDRDLENVSMDHAKEDIN